MGQVKLERADRTLGPEPAWFPQVVLVEFHNFNDNQKVMDAARPCPLWVIVDSCLSRFCCGDAEEVTWIYPG